MLTEDQELVLRLARDAGGQIAAIRLKSIFAERGMDWDRLFQILVYLMQDLGLIEPTDIVSTDPDDGSGWQITQQGLLVLEQIDVTRKQELQRQRELQDERVHNWQVSLVSGFGGGALVVALEKLIEWLRS